MSKKRISSAKRKTGGRSVAVKKKVTARKKAKTSKKIKKVGTKKKASSSSLPLDKALKRHVFLGVSLAGGKTDRSCLAVVEYYPYQHKVFLARLIERVKTEGEVSADLQLHYLINQFESNLEAVAFNAPLSLPKCMQCQLACPGYESCKEPHIRWMWQHYRRQKKKKGKLQKLFTPYTERCTEQYVATELEEPFHPSHALGANAAPLMARAHFIRRRLKAPIQEVYPKLSLWRLGRALGIQKSYLRYHKHAMHGEEARSAIMTALIEKDIAFIYDQDVRAMIENGYAFDAFLCGLTAVLSHQGQCESSPKDFPSAEGWIEIPKQRIDWSFGGKKRKL